MRTASSAFSLIELLVVVTILAILLSILLPVIGIVRLQSKMTRCMVNQKQIAMASLTRMADRRTIFSSVWDYNRTGIQAERMWRYAKDAPENQVGWWNAGAQGKNDLNLPEMLEYMDGGEASFRSNNVLNCPVTPSDLLDVLGQNSDVNGYWYKQIYMSYAYTGWSESWSSFSNDSERFCPRIPSAQGILVADSVFRWTGGTLNGYPQAPWSANHSEMVWPAYGPPKLRDVNQAFGDGSVRRKRGADFDPVAMDAMSNDPTKVLFIRSATSVTDDRRFF